MPKPIEDLSKSFAEAYIAPSESEATDMRFEAMQFALSQVLADQQRLLGEVAALKSMMRWMAANMARQRGQPVPPELALDGNCRPAAEKH